MMPAITINGTRLHYDEAGAPHFVNLDEPA